jgi:dimethylhistidine N-methyltransferase
VLRGLGDRPRWLPSKLLYDARGSKLFERICQTPEYYLSRVELEIMRRSAGEMAHACGSRCLLIEYGSGSGAKTRLLLQRLVDPAGYVPVDISVDALQTWAAALSSEFPQLRVFPLCADYTGPCDIPQVPAHRRVVYFPGSTLGNFEPDDAVDFLRRAAQTCGTGGALLVGIDLQKSPAILEPAYADAEGVTAEFELNVLERLNREFGADFDLDAFEYLSFYNAARGRIEMYLVSRCDQRVRLGEAEIALARGERIRTEYSYKYTLEDFSRLAALSGLSVERVWLDAEQRFSVHLLGVR